MRDRKTPRTHWRLSNGNIACRRGVPTSIAVERRYFLASENKCIVCLERFVRTEQAEERIREIKRNRRRVVQ